MSGTKGEVPRDFLPAALRAIRGPVLSILLLGLGKQGIHRGLPMRRFLLQAFVTHRLLLGGLCFDLRPLPRHMAQFPHPCLATQPEPMEQHPFEFGQMLCPKLCNRSEVGGLLCAPSLRNAMSAFQLTRKLPGRGGPPQKTYSGTVTSIRGWKEIGRAHV